MNRRILLKHIPAAVMLAAGLFVFVVPALADPAGRVARIAFISGDVSFRLAKLSDWTPASLNYPMTVGDSIWTDKTGRAELQIGPVVLRLAANSSVSFLTLDDKFIQVSLVQGALSADLRKGSVPGSVEIDMPNGVASNMAIGSYRFDVSIDGDRSTATVRHGELDATAGLSSIHLTDDQAVNVLGLEAPVTNITAPAPFDEWEDWCAWRERRVENLASESYVSVNMVGYDDLDEFGAWQTVDVYGPVWFPDVRPGWAPYRFGHWVWVEPWGWTWIDDAAWGFAPFHYGRWLRLNGAWAWLPGSIGFRPVYAPALVVFIGIGAPVAWFPLGPEEIFRPVYPMSPAYLRAINAPHRDMTRPLPENPVYCNRTVPGAITAISRETFTHGRSVSQAAMNIPADTLRKASIVPDLAVSPERASILGDSSARAAVPPTAVTNRGVTVRTQPLAPAAKGLVRSVLPAVPQPAVPKADTGEEGVPPSGAADMDTRHAAERTEMETRHAAEQEQLKQQQLQQQKQAQDEAARRQLQQRQEEESRQLQQRQQQEHQQLQQRQQQEKAQQRPRGR